MATSTARRLRHTTILVLLFAGLLGSVGVRAQEPIVPLQLSSSDPGARSMGCSMAMSRLYVAVEKVQHLVKRKPRLRKIIYVPSVAGTW